MSRSDPGTGAAAVSLRASTADDAMLRPIRGGNAFEETVERILQVIKLGVIVAGERLPPERELSVRLNVSRVTLREAIRALQEAGYVESRRGRYGGTFVRRASPGDLARPLTNLISRGHAIADVIEVRGLLEPAIAAQAAERIRPDELAQLREILEAQARKIAADEPYAEEDARFHELIAHAARNDLLTTMLGVIWDVLRTSREEWLQTNQRAHASIDAHQRILAALEAGDASAARSVAAEHIHEVGEAILKLLATSANGTQPTETVGKGT